VPKRPRPPPRASHDHFEGATQILKPAVSSHLTAGLRVVAPGTPSIAVLIGVQSVSWVQGRTHPPRMPSGCAVNAGLPSVKTFGRPALHFQPVFAAPHAVSPAAPVRQLSEQ